MNKNTLYDYLYALSKYGNDNSIIGWLPDHVSQVCYKHKYTIYSISNGHQITLKGLWYLHVC